MFNVLYFLKKCFVKALVNAYWSGYNSTANGGEIPSAPQAPAHHDNKHHKGHHSGKHHSSVKKITISQGFDASVLKACGNQFQTAFDRLPDQLNVLFAELEKNNIDMKSTNNLKTKIHCQIIDFF